MLSKLEEVSDQELRSMIVSEQETLLTLSNSPRFDRATAFKYHETKQRLNILLEIEKNRSLERTTWRGRDY